MTTDAPLSHLHGPLVELRPGMTRLQRAAAHHARRGAPRRLLLISYQFPPTGGGGVQRAVKFSKYLPRCGWRPTVLTVANPSVPVQDRDLASDLDPNSPVVHAKTWEPGYGMKSKLTDAGDRWRPFRRMIRQLAMQVLQPDPQVLWNPLAYRVAVETLRREPHDAIVVTAPPFSSFLLGCRLKRRFGIPLVLDFRDEWMLVGKYMENHQMNALASRVQRAMMNRALRAADAVVTTTEASAAELTECCRLASSAASVRCIYNGFDPDDFQGLAARAAGSGKLRIVYTGTLWKLTDISPLVAALEAIDGRAARLAAKVELIVAGRVTAEQDAQLDRLGKTAVSVVRHDYLPHGEALRRAASADQLLLLLADQPGAQRVVPAKLFEYLAVGRSIMAICPDGETGDLLRRHAHGIRFRPTEIDRIANWLESELAAESRCRVSSTTHHRPAELDRFSRPRQTQQLADLLQQCLRR